MQKTILFSLLLITALSSVAQNNKLSKQIVGRWLFLYAEPKDIIVQNKTLKNNILLDIENNKQILTEQILEYTADGKLNVIQGDTINEGTYTIEGNVETYIFDEYSYSDVVTIHADSLFLDIDETTYYKQEVYNLAPDLENNDYGLSKAITRYVYIRKNDK